MADLLDSIGGFADKTWNGIGEAWSWLRGVVFGEWEDNRSTSQIVTDALAGFVPGLGSVITLRDLLAVIFRLAKYPEKRKDVEEWILLIAMLLPLIITVLGAAVAGIGALVGEEVGGFLRAIALFLVKKGGVTLKVLVDFMRAHGYGDVIAALREVKFARYQAALSREMANQIAKLQALLEKLAQRAAALSPENWPDWMPGVESLRSAPAKAREWIAKLGELGQQAKDMIPKALIELDQRLGALLAGDVKAATQSTYHLSTGVQAPAVARAEEDAQRGIAHNKGDPEPGNTRRVQERQVVHVSVVKRNPEYVMTNEKGLPVGAKPYVEGQTVMEHPPLEKEDWDDLKAKTQEGYPDVTKDALGRPDSKFDTFSKMEPFDIQPGESAVRVIPYDGQPYADTGAFWTQSLPADGAQMRSGTAVKENWNKNGSYVELTAPPAGDPVWKEIHAARAESLGVSPNDLPYEETIKGWKGPAASQRYEYIDPESEKVVGDNYYLPGGDEQYYLNPKEMSVLKEHGYISERKPTNFDDYDPDVINPKDGTKGNIVSKDGPKFIQIPTETAIPRPQNNSNGSTSP